MNKINSGKVYVYIAPEFVRAGNYRIPGGEAAMAELMHSSLRPTALLTANDLTAIGAVGAIRHLGLTVPGDFSVIGFDDIELSDILHPPLTTLRLSRPEFAKIFFCSAGGYEGATERRRPSIFHKNKPDHS